MVGSFCETTTASPMMASHEQRVRRVRRRRPLAAGQRSTRLSAGLSVTAGLALLAFGQLRATMATASMWERLSLADGDDDYHIAPAARARHAVELWGSDTLVVFGGEGANDEQGAGDVSTFSLLGDLWALNLTAAFGTTQYGNSSESVGWQMLHEGGSQEVSDEVPDGLSEQTDSSSGLLSELSDAPSARCGVASAVAGGEGVAADTLIIFGGMVLDAEDDSSDDGTPTYALSDELWTFVLGGELGWQQMPSWQPEDGPTARHGSTGSFIDGSFLVLGGGSFDETFGELWSYDLTSQTWDLLSGPSEPSVSPSLARWGHATTPLPAEMIAGVDDESSSGWTEKLVLFGGFSVEDGQERTFMSPASVVDLVADSGDSVEDGTEVDLFEVDLSPALLRVGHSMVADSKGLLWVHGGIVAGVDTLSNRTLVMYLGSDAPFDSFGSSTSGASSASVESVESVESTSLHRQRRLGAGSPRRERSLRAPAPPAATRRDAEAVRATPTTRTGSVTSRASPHWRGDVQVEVDGTDDGAWGRGERKLSYTSRIWWEYVPESSDENYSGSSYGDDTGPGQRAHHGAVLWDGRMVLHGGRLSPLAGHVSPDMWSLAVDVLDDTDRGNNQVAIAVLESLVQAEPDVVEDVQNLTGWTVSGVLVLTFVAALVAWMIKHVLSCALDKLRPHDDDDDDRHGAASSTSASTSGVRDTAGANGVVGAAPVPPRAVVSSTSGRDRRGLSPSEIALLPVRHFVRPSVATPPGDAADASAGGVKDICLARNSRSSSSSRGCGRSSSGVLEIELSCRQQEGEARPRMKRLCQGVTSSTVSEATTPLSPSSLVSETVPSDRNHHSKRGEKEIITGSGTGGRTTDETCAICLSAYVEHCSLRVLLPCEHVFHSGCVDEWLSRQGVCPICKTLVNAAAGSCIQQRPALDPELGGSAGHLGFNGARAAVRAITAWITPRVGESGEGAGAGGGAGGSGGEVAAAVAEAMVVRDGGVQSSGSGSVAGGNANRVFSAPQVLLRSATTTGIAETQVRLGDDGGSARPPTQLNSTTATGLDVEGWRDNGGGESPDSGGNNGSVIADPNAVSGRLREVTVADSSAPSSRAHSRGGRAAGPRGVPGALHYRIPMYSLSASFETSGSGSASASGAAGDVGTPVRMNPGRRVRVWEAETADANVVITHYENPLFGHSSRS
ncbi:unnamed protein product [Scytosiphon promiscuus]